MPASLSSTDSLAQFERIEVLYWLHLSRRDLVHIKAGERHWHGAKANTTMGHITITLVGSQATHG